MAAGRLGLFVMIDGLDGSGKGVILDALRDYAIQKLGKSVFLSKDHHLKTGFYPELSDFVRHDVVLSFEPTRVGIGKVIMEELTADNTGRRYSARSVAQAYALERLVIYSRMYVPGLKVGKWFFADRGIPATLVYQPLQAKHMLNEELSLDYLMSLDGNKMALENPPDLLIIPTIKDVQALAQRRAQRGKDDKSIFEQTWFQEKLKEVYESAWLREIFEKRGTAVRYFDADVSVEHSRSEAVRILEEFLKSRGKVK